MEERLTKETSPFPFTFPATTVLEKVLQALENSNRPPFLVVIIALELILLPRST
jgi:hypothetical protein